MSTESSPVDSESPRRLRRLWFVPFHLWPYAIVGLVLISPLLVRAWFLSKIPDIGEPFDLAEFCRADIQPGQNAFDHYFKACRLKDTVDAIQKINNTPMPADDYKAVIENGWSAASDPLKVWLADCRESLTEWQRGTELHDSFDISLREMDFSTATLDILSMRDFAKIAQCEAARLEAEGDFDVAAKWYIAILRCSRHSCRQGVFIQRLVGCALHAMSTEGLVRWAEYSDVKADQLQTALNAVRAADRMTVPLSTTLKAEYIVAINSLMRRDWLQTCGLTETDNEPIATAKSAFYWIVGEPLSTQRIQRQVLANQLNEIDKPLPDRQATAGTGSAMLFQPDPSIPLKPNQLNPAGIERAIQRSIVTSQDPPVFKQVEVAIARERARQITLEVALAAQAYRRDHGEFPEDPMTLVPSYLDVWPVDPSDKTGQSIRYRRETSTSAVVWSVGTDGNDDGGEVNGPNSQSPDVGIILKAR